MIVLSDIALQLPEGFLESQHVCIPIEVVSDCRPPFQPVQIAVGVNDVHYALDHVLLADPSTGYEAPGVVPVHPDLNDPLLVDPYVLLLHLEAPVALGYEVEAVEGLGVEVQEVRVRNVLNVDEPNRDLLDEEAVLMTDGTKLLLLLLLVVERGHQLRVPVPEVKNLPGLLQLLVVSREDVVLLYLEVFLVATPP